MTKKSIQKVGLYLMGQLTGPNGVKKEGNGLFPLAGYSIALPELSVENIDDNSASQNQQPIYFSDSTGRLQGWNSKVVSIEDLENEENVLSTAALTISEYGSSLETVFIPPYLIPASVMSSNNDWASSLYKTVKEILKSRNEREVKSAYPITMIPQTQFLKEKDMDQALRTFCPPEVASFFISQSEASERVLSKTQSSYKKMYDKIYSGKYLHNFHFLRVPQVWTINLVFSADYFEGAKVRISGVPETLLVEGDYLVDLRSSLVRRTQYYDFSDETESEGKLCEQYVATFWITGGYVENEDDLKKLCRFDIDLGHIETYWTDDSAKATEAMGKVTALNIPDHRYSISEQVLHLPIQSIAGRSVLVSGDPVSVEEALFQHAPNTFKHLVDWSQNQPYTKENKPVSGAQPGLNILNTLSVYKGVIEASTTGVMDPFSMTMVHKAFSAGLSDKLADDEMIQVLNLAVGIDAKAKSFIEFTNKLKNPGSREGMALFKDLAAAMHWSGNASNFSGAVHVIPPVLRQFWHQVDNKILVPLKPLAKAIEIGLDKPFGFAQVVSSFLDIGSAANSAEDAFNMYMSKSTEYTEKTLSVVSSLMDSDEQKRQSFLQEEAEKKKALLEALSSKIQQNKVLLNGKPPARNASKLGQANYLTLFFDFDGASYQLSNADLILINSVATYLQNTEVEMTLMIRGYTCDIGESAYNLELSSSRAESLRQAILNQLSISQKKKWQERIIAIGMGEQDLISTENKAINRRAELEFFIHSAYDYPLCRSHSLVLEKTRQKAVDSELKMNDAVLNFSGQAFDIALGLAGACLGPVAAVAYGLYWTGDALSSVLKGVEKQLEPELVQYENQQKILSELDVVSQALMLKDGAAFNDLSVLGKAYLKRSIALNGLLRLLLQESYLKELEKSGTNNHYGSEYYSVNHLGDSNKRDLDVQGYIKTFILSDDWELGSHWNTSFHLDEVWLETKHIYQTAAESIKSYVAIVNYIWYRIKQGDQGKSAQTKAQAYQKYCPVHTVADPSLNMLRNMLKKPKLKGLNDKIYAGHLVSVCKFGSKNWKTLEHIVNAGGAITPTDKVRVLIILDMKNEDLCKIQKEGLLNYVPIGVRPVKQNRIFDDKGAYTTEYVREISQSALTDNEKEYLVQKELLSADEVIYGVVITPTYFLGTSIIHGIKPIADDYDSDEWKALYGAPDKQESNEYRMRYALEAAVPGVSDTESNLTYTRTLEFKMADGKIVKSSTDRASIFDLCMTKDHRFLYEKRFLARTDKKEVEYPELFSDSKINLYFEDQNAKYLIPGHSHSDMMEAIGWSKQKVISSQAKKMLVVVSTKSVENAEELLTNGKFDTHRIPVDTFLKANDSKGLFNRKLGKANFLYPIGKIKVVDAEKKHFSYEAIPTIPKFVELSAHLEKNMAKLLPDFSVSDSSLFSSSFVGTDLYVMEVPLDYLNVTGKKIDGLRPFIPVNKKSKVWVEIHGRAGLGLSESSNKVEVAGVKVLEPTALERRKIVFDKEWYEMEEGEFNKIKQYSSSASNSSLEENVANFSENKLKYHESSKLMNWMNAAPKMTDYPLAKEIPLSEQRIEMLEEWLFDPHIPG